MPRKQTHRFSSGSFDYGTPTVWVEGAREVMGGIDLDPASSPAFNRIVQARAILTIADNALDPQRRWFGNLWVNPPYNPAVKGKPEVSFLHVKFIQKLIAQYTNGNVAQACLLVNAETGMPWFKPLWQYAVCLAYERIKFYQVFDGLEGPDSVAVTQTQPTHNNALVYLPPLLDRFDHLNRFEEVFAPLGRVIPPEGLITRLPR